MDYASEPLLQFQNHSNCASYCQRAQGQDDRRSEIVRRGQTKACEQQRQPKDEKSDERLRSSLPNLLRE